MGARSSAASVLDADPAAGHDHPHGLADRAPRHAIGVGVDLHATVGLNPPDQAADLAEGRAALQRSKGADVVARVSPKSISILARRRASPKRTVARAWARSAWHSGRHRPLDRRPQADADALLTGQILANHIGVAAMPPEPFSQPVVQSIQDPCGRCGR